MAIIWTKNAVDELTEIVSQEKYNMGKSPARNLYLRIKAKMERINIKPGLQEVMPEMVDIGFNHIYQAAESPWVIAYKIENKTICVLSIINVGKELDEILYNKFLEGKIV